MENFNLKNIEMAIEFAQRRCSQSHISYTELFAASEMQSPQWYHENGGQRVITDFMETFHIECLKRDLPPFDSFVVNEGGERAGYPGMGYFKVNGMKDPLSDKTSDADSRVSLDFQKSEREKIRQWCRSH